LHFNYNELPVDIQQKLIELADKKDMEEQIKCNNILVSESTNQSEECLTPFDDIYEQEYADTDNKIETEEIKQTETEEIKQITSDDIKCFDNYKIVMAEITNPVVSIKEVYDCFELTYPDLHNDLLFVDKIINYEDMECLHNTEKYRTMHFINCQVKSFTHEPQCNLIFVDTLFDSLSIVNNGRNLILLSCTKNTVNYYNLLKRNTINSGKTHELYKYKINQIDVIKYIFKSGGKYYLRGIKVCNLIESIFDESAQIVFDDVGGVVLIDKSSKFLGTVKNGKAYFEQ
jgi:hypothetical protein